MGNTTDGSSSLGWQLWEAEGRTWEWLHGPCTAPRKLRRRGQLAPVHGAHTAGEGASKPTKLTRKSQGTKQEMGQERRRNQRQVQMEQGLKHLCSGVPSASLSVCGAIPKAPGRGELSRLVHVAPNPLWENSGGFKRKPQNTATCNKEFSSLLSTTVNHQHPFWGLTFHSNTHRGCTSSI